MIMQLIKKTPTTNGTRHQLNLQKNLLSKNTKLIKALNKGFKINCGRSSITGHITVRHKGRGCKKNYRYINFFNNNYFSIILATFYDPNRSSFISLNYNFEKKLFFNTLATNNAFPGSLTFCSNIFKELKLGCRTLLKNLPTGSLIHSISTSYSSKTKYVRSAGTFCQLIQKDLKFCKLKFPSGKIFTVSANGYATIGIISNLKNNLIMSTKSLLKFKSNRFLAKNIWPTRKISIKQKNI